MSNNEVNAKITVPEMNILMYQQGPKGVGIKSINQENNKIRITLDNNQSYYVAFPNWWFGTRTEYNRLSADERNASYMHFILEGS